MNLVQRAININTQPRPEWAQIAAEPGDTGRLILGYALPLALLPFVGTLLGGLIFAGALGFTFVLVTAALSLAISLGILILMGIIAGALAPSFDGRNTNNAALKLLVYASTPVWLAGFFGGFIPILGFLIVLVGYGYAAYLMYLGSMTVLGIPQQKAVGYTAVVIIIWFLLGAIVTGLIVTAVAVAILGGAAMTGGMMIR
ncbi:MAG TPA: Yip1 family protein [Allosphingosinicella sp.]